MKYPNFNEEKKLWRKGFKIVAGLDEAGRGSLAGPVVAAACALRNFKFAGRRIADSPKGCILNLKSILNDKNFKLIKDSKLLSAKKREKFYKILTKHPQIEWGIGVVSEKVIDKINILEATKLAMTRAIAKLKTKSAKRKIDFLILDGKMKLNLPIPQKSIVKADVKVFSCAAASIIAKVRRDRIMLKYDKKYPRYGFKKHKGYPTKLHCATIKKIGLCPFHRKSFKFS